MSINMQCPHCGRRLKISESNLDSMVRCPDCKERFLCKHQDGPSRMAPGVDEPSTMFVDSSAAVDLGGDEGATDSGRGSNGTDAGLLLSGLIGALATVAVFYGLVRPFEHTAIGSMFAVGWVPQAIVFLTAWSAAILAFKFLKIRRQRSSLLFDLLPRDISPVIRPENVGQFLAHVLSLPVAPRNSFLVSRVQKGLKHFRARRSLQEVSSLLSSQSEIDGLAVDSSYTMLRVFIWAVPILGFIGTVVGIGDAVGSFSASIETAQEIEVIKQSLGGVTAGLGFAFNTTLIALVMSILLMLPTNWLQKLEEDVLNSVGDYCNEELLMRIVDESDPGSITHAPDHLERVLADHRAALDAWAGDLASIGSRLSGDVVAGWGEVRGQVEAAMKAQADDAVRAARQAVQAQAEERLRWSEGFASLGEALDARAAARDEAQAERLDGVVEALREVARVQAQGNEELLGSHRARIEELTRTIESGWSEASEAIGAASRAQAEGARESADAVTAALHSAAVGLTEMSTRLSELAPALEGQMQELAKRIAASGDAPAIELRELRQELSENVRGYTESFDRIGSAQAKVIGDAAQAMREVHAALGEELPGAVAAQTRALELSRQECERLVAAQESLVSRIADLGQDRSLLLSLRNLRKTLAQLSGSLESLERRMPAERRGFRIPFLARNDATT